MSAESETAGALADPSQPAETLLRSLRTGRDGLSAREAARRLVRYGPNTLTRRTKRAWPHELIEQFTHPLAVLLEAAGALAFLAGTPVLGWAILAVVVLNAAFAFWQERQAERAVEALRAYLPQHAAVLRGGAATSIEASTLVPGDVLMLAEGQRVSADARMLDGEVEVDLATLTGESLPQARNSELAAADLPLLQATDLVFSGTTCLSGAGRALVYATGDHTELGRIARCATTRACGCTWSRVTTVTPPPRWRGRWASARAMPVFSPARTSVSWTMRRLRPL